MEPEKLAHLKQKLLDEQKLLESELSTIGRKNTGTGEWEAKVVDDDSASTESDEKADKFEEYEENSSVLDTLQARLHDITRALEKMADGTYGVCEVSGDPIEDERLEVNPAARTCEKHLNTSL